MNAAKNVLIVGSSSVAEGLGGFAGIGLALLWGGMTLFAAWFWVFGRWRVVIAPVITGSALVVASVAFGS